MAITRNSVKTINQTYLFKENATMYEKIIVNFLKGAKEIDVLSKEFEDVYYDVKKRQVNKFVISTLEMEDVKLMISSSPLPRSMSVICARDFTSSDQSKYAIYIDCSAIMEEDEDGKYYCNNIDQLIAHLVNATANMLYFNDLLQNNELVETGTYCFSMMFSNILNYLYKINNIRGLQNKALYISSMYFLHNILGINNVNNNMSLSKKIAKMTDREIDLINMHIKPETFYNINNFTNKLGDILKLDDVTTSSIVSTWMRLYTPGTLFALEYFPAFSAMLTNAYIGCYLNNQSTIEKITNKGLPRYAKTIIKIGGKYAK